MGSASAVLDRPPVTVGEEGAEIDRKVLEAFREAGCRVEACDVEGLSGKLYGVITGATPEMIGASVGRLCRRSKIKVHTDYGYFSLTSSGRAAAAAA